MRKVVAIAGIETLRDENGNVIKYCDTFLDNILTWQHENQTADLTIIDARNYIHTENPIASVWNAVLAITHIDELIFSCHSSSESLIIFSHVRTELPVEQRYFRVTSDYTAVYNEDAIIRIWGCQAGGEEGQKWPNSIAQVIANMTGKTVLAFVSKSSQREYPKGRFHQIPDKGGVVKFTCTPVAS